MRTLETLRILLIMTIMLVFGSLGLTIHFIRNLIERLKESL